jgi:hypothetical protein
MRDEPASVSWWTTTAIDEIESVVRCIEPGATTSPSPSTPCCSGPRTVDAYAMQQLLEDASRGNDSASRLC